MRNMPVGKKILTGFLIVILMIGIILAMTIITSLSRNSELERVDKMSGLQTAANNLLNEFNLARVEIRSVFTSIEAEEEYNLALEYLDSCLQQMDEMKTLSAGLDGYMMAEIDEIDKMLGQVRAGLVNVRDNDELAISALAEMTNNGTTLNEDSTNLFNNVIEGTLNTTSSDSTSGNRVRDIIVPTKELNDSIADTRVLARTLLFNQDLSVVPTLYEGLDTIETQAGALRPNLITDEGRQHVDTLIDAAAGFRSSIEETNEILLRTEAEVESTREVFVNLNEHVNAYVNTISEDVNILNESVTTTSTITMYIMIGVAVASVIISFFIAQYIGKLITRPLNKMKDVMLQAGSSGNLHFTDETKEDVRKEAQASDEIGQSLSAFTSFIDHIIVIAGQLEKIAAKDLTVEVDLLSEEDTMGISLQDMLKNLNHMFSEINMIAAQVSTAAGEVSTGAQALAQGSTQQAATVQEISASMNEINEQMSSSNETITSAANESETISQMALDGNTKMTSMVNSMKEITEASQAIERVIKVIDDIAFQTNILALNAAVEAARAGSAGQGFAVVADEVRNLAAKSAEAAKETSTLISANIEKTQSGLATTQETADSLTQIMEGIEKNRESLQTVSQQSESVRASTTEVNTAIDQTAQVVQQNSATSEESAAASEQMSSQAQSLQTLISQFKLKNEEYSIPKYRSATSDGSEAVETGDETDTSSISKY